MRYPDRVSPLSSRYNTVQGLAFCQDNTFSGIDTDCAANAITSLIRHEHAAES